MFIVTETIAPARPCETEIIKAATWDYAGSPVVTIFKGELSQYTGRPLYAHRRPRGKHVHFNGMNMLLTDPVRIGSTTVFNVAGGTTRTVVSEVHEVDYVNGFEIKELPDGYVDCVAWDGCVMATFSSRHDAVVWAISEVAPALSASAKAELAALQDQLN